MTGTATLPAADAHDVRARLPFVTYLLAGGTFLMGTSEFVVAGLLPEVARDFSVSVAQAGLAITAFALGMVLGTPLMVLLTLRLPRRTTLTLALIVFAVGHVLAALTGVFWVLLAARFLTAVATGAFWAVSSLVAADAAGTRAISVVQSGGMLATVLGVPIGSFAGQLIGWRGPFWALAALAAVAAVAVFRLVAADHGDRPVPRLRSELAALRSGPLWLVLATCGLVTGGVLSVFSYISPLLTDRTGLPSAAVPAVLVLFGIGALVGSLVGGRLGHTHPAAAVFGTAGVTLAAVVALLACSTMPVPTVLLFALLGLSGLSGNSVLVALAIRFGGDAPTLATGLTPSAFNVGTAIGTAVCSALLPSALGELAPPLVGTVAAVGVLLVFGALTLATRRSRIRA